MMADALAPVVAECLVRKAYCMVPVHGLRQSDGGMHQALGTILEACTVAYTSQVPQTQLSIVDPLLMLE